MKDAFRSYSPIEMPILIRRQQPIYKAKPSMSLVYVNPQSRSMDMKGWRALRYTLAVSCETRNATYIERNVSWLRNSARRLVFI